VTNRELAFVNQAVEGMRQARADLAVPDPTRPLAAALESLFAEHPKPLRNREIGYLAYMVMVWQDMGSPDLLT